MLYDKCSKYSTFKEYVQFFKYNLVWDSLLLISRFWLWLFHETIWICLLRINMLVTSQY
jgi:hypothetical protein